MKWKTLWGQERDGDATYYLPSQAKKKKKKRQFFKNKNYGDDAYY